MMDDRQDEWVTPDEVATVMMSLVQQDRVSEVIGDGAGEASKGKTEYPVTGGTVLEVSKTVRTVSPYNDPGPVGRPGATVATTTPVHDEVWELLASKGWGA